jgi:hypothetical protein
MSSQAYMLVYIKTSSLRENMKMLDVSLVDGFIREKVDRENQENRRMEYWNEHQLFYLILPELLRGKEMNGCILNHTGNEDAKKVERFIEENAFRFAAIFSRQQTIAEWLEELSRLIGVSSNRLVIFKYDHGKHWFVPVTSKKVLSEASNRKLSSIFRPLHNLQDHPILFIYIIGQTSPLLIPTEQYIISEQIFNNEKKDKYINSLKFRDSPMIEEGEDDLKTHQRFHEGELALVLIKSFNHKPHFQECQLLPKSMTFEDLNARYPDKLLYHEEVCKEKQLEITLFSDLDFDLIQSSSKKEAVVIILVDKNEEDNMKAHYDDLREKTYVSFFQETDHNNNITELLDQRMSVSAVFDKVWEQCYNTSIDKDRLFLKVYESSTSLKIIYNEETAEYPTLGELVAII